MNCEPLTGMLSYSRRCVKSLLLFWNNKLVESMILMKGFMQHQEQCNCIYSHQKIVLFCHQITLMLNATSLFLVREHLLLNFVTKNLRLKESEMMLLYSSWQHSGMNKVKGSLISSSFSMTWRRIGLINKSNSNNRRFGIRLKKERTNQCICKNVCSSVNDRMDLQLVLKKSIQSWTRILIRERK